jgi:hypothetical protein
MNVLSVVVAVKPLRLQFATSKFSCINIAQPAQSAESSSSLRSVRLCFSPVDLRLLTGSVRVGGGVPIAARAAAFTADAARNGFGLRFFDGMVRAPSTTL